MMLTFQHLLLLIPEVISPNHGLIKFFIDAPDRVGVITLPKLIKACFEVGKCIGKCIHSHCKSGHYIVDTVCKVSSIT